MSIWPKCDITKRWNFCIGIEKSSQANNIAEDIYSWISKELGIDSCLWQSTRHQHLFYVDDEQIALILKLTCSN